MAEVVGDTQRLNEHVIDVYFHGVAELICEHSIHEPLLSRSRVHQAEWHDFVTVGSPICDKCCFLAIVRMHHDLVVSGECVHEREHLVSDCGFD